MSINGTLESLGKTINDYRVVDANFDTEGSEYLTREIMSERGVPVPDFDIHALHQLNVEQQVAFAEIFSIAISGGGGAYFVDGPGGTGKSFLYRVLLAHIRSLGKIAIIVASSGRASSAFPGGRTAHSRFKIPINGLQGVRCQTKEIMSIISTVWSPRDYLSID
ncbi:hypothetical protein LIER_30098 [Lithospermum erythrorhizon]|uniref:ATP-dependent DNA helicase n=1 Tax=Lithospermum erythrorhizon TaxID=34254 RepID=A0AAV3RQ28_LITER